MVDPTSSASLGALNPTARNTEPTSTNTESKPSSENVVETGRTSEVGPAAVVTLSSTPETTAAVKSASQSADTGAAPKVADEGGEEAAESSARQPVESSEQYRQQGIDLTV